MSLPFKSYIGEKYGRLTVTGVSNKVGKNNNRKYRDVICECGTTKSNVDMSSLKNGVIKSCGCYRIEFGKAKKGISKYTDNTAAFNHAYAGYRSSANDRNYAFELTKDEFRDITSKICKYCKLPPSNVDTSQTGQKYISSGIDRVDNTKGYIIGNVVPCCKTCNRAKDTMTLEEFHAWINRVYGTLN